MPLLAAVVFVLAGAVLLLLGLAMRNADRHARSGPPRTSVEGVVVDAEWSLLQTGQHVRLPVVEFRDGTGRAHRIRQDRGSTMAPEVGRRVAVRYDPSKPEAAEVAGGGQGPLAWVLVGAGALGLALGGALLAGAVGA